MPIDFHKDMDNYLTKKRRKKIFSNIKSRVMNKKAVVSYKAANKFGNLKGKVVSKVEEMKKRKKESKGEITQEQIDDTVDKGGVKRFLKRKIKVMPKEGEGGWEEVKIEKPKGRREGIGSLEEEKRKIQEGLAEIQNKREAEKEKIVRLSEENEQRAREESDEDRIKRLELEDEVKILKEKQKIEKDRLMELRKARRREQIESLRGRVTDILFKKGHSKEKDMVEEVRKEVRRDARIKEAKRQRDEAEQPKEEVITTREQPQEGKKNVPNVSGALNRIFGKLHHPEAEPEISQIKPEKIKTEELKIKDVEEKAVEKKKSIKKKPKKSFFSNFIQIKTAEQIAKEEEEILKEEEKQALKDHSEISDIFGKDVGEIKTNIPKEEQSANLSTLFPGDSAKQEVKAKGDTIELDQGYKIKVVKN